jgi:hypothetical protein
MSSSSSSPSSTPIGLIVFAWVLVAIPLLYGLYQTVKTAITLFTG